MVLVVLVVAGVLALVALVALASALLRTLHELRATVDAVRRESVAVLAELSATAAAAGVDVDRIDGLLDAAESISANLEGASRVGYVAFRRPVVKVVAFWRGVGRAVRRAVGLRGGPA
jgi:hypothetical protein